MAVESALSSGDWMDLSLIHNLCWPEVAVASPPPLILLPAKGRRRRRRRHWDKWPHQQPGADLITEREAEESTTAVQYSQYSRVEYSTVPYRTEQNSTVQNMRAHIEGEAVTTPQGEPCAVQPPWTKSRHARSWCWC